MMFPTTVGNGEVSTLEGDTHSTPLRFGFGLTLG
jgi:hypothetical protein